MENNTSSLQDKRSPARDWLNPLRLYDPRIPAGRWTFLWGLAIYPFIVMFVFTMVVIILIETFASSANVADYIGIVAYVFMLGWVAAVVCICRRRLLTLEMSPMWVWVAIIPIVNLFLFLYLLIKSGRGESRPVA